jgi:hypothetical protein
MEIVYSFEKLLGLSALLIVRGLAAAICRAHAKGNVIRSLGFIVENIWRRAADGDMTWAIDTPVTIEQSRFDQAYEWAAWTAQRRTERKLSICRADMLSTGRVEALADLIAKYGTDSFEVGVEWALAGNQVLKADHTIICATWFESSVETVHATVQQRRRQEAWQREYAAKRERENAKQRAKRARRKAAKLAECMPLDAATTGEAGR